MCSLMQIVCSHECNEISCTDKNIIEACKVLECFTQTEGWKCLKKHKLFLMEFVKKVTLIFFTLHIFIVIL